MNLLICHAQNSKKNQDEFNDFRTEMYKDFDSFRAEIMHGYIEFVKHPWKDFESIAPVPRPNVEPVPPVVVPDDDKDTTKVENTPIVIDEVITPAPITPQPQPIEEIPEYEEDERLYEYNVDLSFYGTPLSIRYPKNEEYHIGELTEQNVAAALSTLATNQYDNSIIDCLKIREEYKLCDWAYLQFVQQVSEKACGDSSNESTLFTAYILMQSGYRIRLAYSADKLYVLYASKHCMFDKCSYMVDGECYYGLVELPSRLMVSQASFPQEQSISLLIHEQPLLTEDLSPKRMIMSKAYPSFKVSVNVNKNLLAFYESYPCSYYNDNYMTQWAQYANTPIDPQIASTVYPNIRKMFYGLTERERVSRLLNWIQTGFKYEFDDKVWGHDRTFFAEETFFYPFCDCEDRSVLFTRLVRDLLGLQCVLLYYPGHLATAVSFTSPVNGDYIELNGKKYIVCDPTYIGASVGMTMPGMNNAKAGVIVLD